MKQGICLFQGEDMFATYDAIADYLLDTTMFYFEDKMRQAKVVTGGHRKLYKTKSDNIFARLASEFTLDQALQQAQAVKGDMSKNSVKTIITVR